MTKILQGWIDWFHSYSRTRHFWLVPAPMIMGFSGGWIFLDLVESLGWGVLTIGFVLLMFALSISCGIIASTCKN